MGAPCRARGAFVWDVDLREKARGAWEPSQTMAQVCHHVRGVGPQVWDMQSQVKTRPVAVALLVLLRGRSDPAVGSDAAVASSLREMEVRCPYWER